MSQKSTEELCFITLTNDPKFEKELSCTLKNDMKNLVNFDPTLESSKSFTLMGSFCPKYVICELKKYKRIMCHYIEDRCKREEFGELYQITQKS